MTEGVKHIIAVASGKGGVGKSTVTANLALAMAAQGMRVGVLDADIYGPSQAQMFDVPSDQKPKSDDGQTFDPVTAKGVQLMSMAFLVDQKTPMIWRGPMASGAFQQLLNQSRWDNLDYLFIDMPPGTGDIQLTMAQKVEVSGAVIVTTPQDIALLDAKRGIEMFRQVKVPVLGVVENMSLHTCSQCGHSEPIFGEGGGERIAKEYQTELLGQLPLALSIREQMDKGHPSVEVDPEGPVAQVFAKIAQKIRSEMDNKEETSGPSISFSD
ncbi:ATP-binding protein involved in chromosome partitioning [Marinospirillum celere]|uniref:Iron-sulfur cluster carrier protein n=1 Tax=Marinospirillum celere TaxID=1122252 RepID=A0A1I1ENM4_9GAMM|nr:ATP-binding protein involved in chromosome partitioning [Marinospirillum celere]